jgi:hypothetical protein
MTDASSKRFFAVENVRRRALPERFGPWNSVGKRFDRLSQAHVFEAFFDALAAMSSSAHLIQMFASTIVRAHVSAAEAKEAERASARCFTTNIHAKSDSSSDVIVFDLTGGEASPCASFRHSARPRPRHAIEVTPARPIAKQRWRAAYLTRRTLASNRSSDASSASNASPSDRKRRLGASPQASA